MATSTRENWNEISDFNNVHYVSQNPAYITVKGTVGDPKPSNTATNTTATNMNNNNNANTARSIERVGFSRNYMLSIRGLLRVALIFSLMGGWIAAAAAQKSEIILSLVADYKATRLAYIIIAVVGDGISIIIYILLLFNIDNVRPISSVNTGFIIFLLDALFFFPMVALGITCSVREADYDKRVNVSQALNKGALGAAAFFAFFSALLYGGACAIELLTIMKSRANRANISGSR